MESLKRRLIASFVGSLALMIVSTNVVQSQVGAERFTPRGEMDDEDRAGPAHSTGRATAQSMVPATEAPTGFDNLTNGFDVQGPDFETINKDNVEPLGSFTITGSFSRKLKR